MLMKKSILIGAALLTAVCANAQSTGTDVTPANYKIQNPGVMLPLADNSNFLNNINLPSPVWQSIDGDKYWNDGLVLINSGGGMTLPQWEDFMQSWNYINFGGEIGRTACFITKDCNIQAVLSDLAPNRADEWDNLNIITNQYGGGAVNFFMDPNNCPTTGFIRVNFIFNIYNNNNDGGEFIQNFNMRGDQNNNNSEWNSIKYTTDPMPGTTITNDICMDDDTGEWDPTKWVSLTYDFTVAEAKDGISYIPARIKMFFKGNSATKESAMFFRNISFTHITDQEPEYLEKANIEYLTLTQDLANTTGIETIESNDVNAPVEYYNLQGVKVANPENGIYIKKQGNTTSKVVVR